MPEVTTIFFDAVGTLFGVQESVGQVYGQAAQRFGVDVDVESLDRAFYQVFKATPPAAFPQVESLLHLADLEREWWRQIVMETFVRLGYEVDRQPFPNFETYFAEVFEAFATAHPWQVYSETTSVLKELQARKFQLGVISNFDSRLPHVLTALELDRFFCCITISTQVGAAKPERQVFRSALDRVQISASQALHVGDSLSMDYQGAKQAGLHALWLNRAPGQSKTQDVVPGPEQIQDLNGILTWLSGS